MKNKIKNIILFLILFLSFLSLSRLLQSLLIWNSENLISVDLLNHNKKNNDCKPKENSLLGYLSSKNDKTLFIVLDGYPVPQLFKKLTSIDSKLHEFLNKSSDFYKFSISKDQWTNKSLAYTLAGIDNSPSNCIYPNFGNTIKPIFLNGSQYFYSKDSFCKSSITEFNERIIYYPLKLLKFFNKNDFYNLRRYEVILEEREKTCSMVNHNINLSMINWIDRTKKTQGIYFFHDIYFHNFIENNKLQINQIEGFLNEKGKIYLKELLEIDEKYQISLEDFLNKAYLSKSLKNIFILSDHGPRTKIFKNKELSLLESKGYFIYYYAIKGFDPNIVEIIKGL